MGAMTEPSASGSRFRWRRWRLVHRAGRDLEEVCDALKILAEQVLSIIFQEVVGPPTASASSTPTITAAAATKGTDGEAYVTAHSIFGACTARTSDFVSLENNMQASCLCYNSGS